jgi:hypothetical protein
VDGLLPAPHAGDDPSPKDAADAPVVDLLLAALDAALDPGASGCVQGLECGAFMPVHITL